MHHLNRLSIVFVLTALFLSACQPAQQAELPPTAQSAPTAAPPPTATRPPTAAAPATATTQGQKAPRIHIESFEFASKALEGNLLGDPATRKTYVYLPPGYAAGTERYPVVYVMPWGDGLSTNNVFGVSGTMDALLQSQEVKEMILVFPDGSNRLGASLFRSSPTVGDYEGYLTQELIGYVDSHYRTLASRDNRGIAGCSNGGEIAMRLGLRYPEIFSVAAPACATYVDDPAENSLLQYELENIDKLPETFDKLPYWNQRFPLASYFIQEAAGNSSNPDNPPFFLDMPFRLAGDHANVEPEVLARIMDGDSAREAQRYVAQPVRLNGLLLQHALLDAYNPTNVVQSFEQLLTDLGIEHEYVEVEKAHCDFDWDGAALKFMSEHLAFEAP